MALVLPRGRPRRSIRPFATTILILSLLTVYSFLLHTSQASAPASPSSNPSRRLVARGRHDPDFVCRDVRFAEDQCAFVRKYCENDNASLISYLNIYYCTFGRVQPLAFLIIILWLGMLFTTIGIAASDFFSINLGTIAAILRLSESFAGVTFLALGNGSPDVFSTLAAMASNSASMAVGELIGAACFISGVVAGSMALVREFQVEKKSYIRDICFLIVAVIATLIFLADGSLHFWECWAMIVFYLVYVATVVGQHWYSSVRKLRRRRDGESRSHFYGHPSQPADELAGEPYRDDPADGDRTCGEPETSNADISSLEAGIHITLDGQDWEEAIDEQAQEHERIVAAQVSHSMRIMRSGRNQKPNRTPIRPSLVGALEFRSALAQLQRESNWQLSSIPSRSYSTNHVTLYSGRRRGSSVAESSNAVQSHLSSDVYPRARGRGRAFSASTVSGAMTETGDLLGSFPEILGEEVQDTGKSASPSFVHTVNGSLAPPPTTVSSAATSGLGKANMQPLLSVPLPTRQGGWGESLDTNASSQLTDSPKLITSTPHVDGPCEFMLPSPTVRRKADASGSFSDCVEPKPVSWWPYSFLPPPHIILATVFPTMQGWGNKSWWDRVVSAISMPSIFLLVLTLPVVEPESGEDDDANTAMFETGQSTPSSPLTGGGVERYCDCEPSNHSSTCTLCRPSPKPNLLISEETLTMRPSAEATSPVMPNIAVPEPPPADYGDDDPRAWNRWLVCVQLFTGPLFVVLIVWANMYNDSKDAGKTLVRMVLYSLLMSLILLAGLMFMTVEHIRPKRHYILCFLGFVISIAWISTIAGEVVGVLQLLGVVLDISEALLGLTIFAAGNSIGDLVADITVARLGHPVMALSACFGGPLLNILLGIGIGGVLMMIQGANKDRRKHPDQPVHYGPYPVRIGGTLIISCATLLVILMMLLIAVPMNKWVLSRKIGWTLIAVWSVSTAVNVAMEVAGVWGGYKS